MTRHKAALVGCALLILVAGCTRDREPSAAPPPATTTPSTTSAPEPDTGLTPAPTSPVVPSTRPTRPAPTSSPQGSGTRITHNWAVPTTPVLIRHDVRVPVAPPPALPLPALTRIEVGDHPAERFSRITFAFRGAFPTYEVSYVPRLEAEGTGDTVPLPGNAFLRIRFENAQAHDGDGQSTIISAPASSIGYPTLRGYGFGGDFEGQVTYGLGLQAAPGSDQALPIRLLETTRPDGSRVVAVDVRYG